MHVVVIGGGVIGLTTAHFLRKSGVEVTLLDRNAGAGLGASYANAGSMTASRAGPWASPRAIAKTIRGYFDQDSAFRLQLRLDPDQWRWLLGFLRSAYSKHASAKRAAMVKLARDSIEERRRLDRELGLDYGGVYAGLLSVYEKAEEFDAAAADIDYLRGLGVEVEALGPADCAALAPSAAWGNLKVVGATLARGDETVDCYRFCEALDQANAGLGVVRRYGELVRRLDTKRFGHCVVRTDIGDIAADAVVLAAGIQSVEQARSQGVRLPIYPVKGYSLSVPLAQDKIPSLTIAHERRKVFVSPSPTGLRAAGVADIVGADLSLNAARIALVRRTVAELFPDADLNDGGKPWAGLRPMSYDGPPVICGVEGTGLWLNTGHGSLGWTMALGAAKLMSELVTRRRHQPENAYFGLELR